MRFERTSASQPWHDRLYLPAYRYTEAARFAQTTAQTVGRWYHGYHAPGHQMEPVFPHSDSNLLSYVQLVETAFVATFRRLGVQLDSLRRAHVYLRQRFGVEYPFAELKLETDGMNVLADVLPESQLWLVVANRGGQLVWTEALRDRFAQFDYEEGIALRWHLRGRDSIILIDPRIAFGAPIIEGAGVPTHVVRERYQAGEDVQDIEADFGISRQQVREALDFEGIRVPAA